MFKLSTAAIAVSLAFLSGCATQAPQRSIVGDALDFGSYTNENTKRTGIAQVFDLEGKTVIQMAGPENTKPRIVDEEGNDVPYTTTGSYLVLDRTPPKFRVTQGAETAVIARALGLPIPSQNTAKPAQTPSPASKRSISTSLNSLPGNDMTRLANDIDARDRYMKAIESLQAQLNDLRNALASLGPTTGNEDKKAAVKKSIVSRKGKPAAVATTGSGAAPAAATSETPAQKHARENAVAKVRAEQVRGLGSMNDM